MKLNPEETIELTEAQARKLCEIAKVEFSSPAGMSWDGSGFSNVKGESMSLPMGAIQKIDRLSAKQYTAIEVAQ